MEFTGERIVPGSVNANLLNEHMQALPHREVAVAIRTVQASAPPGVRLAFEFLVLTAARWAEWAEINRHAGVWTVPARRMKANRQHRVPL